MSDVIMNKLLYLEIDVIGLVFTAILFQKSISKDGIRAISRQQRVFVSMLGFLMVTFVIDGFTWYIDGFSYGWVRPVYNICMVVYFILNPMFGFLWNMYVNTKIYTNLMLIKRNMRMYTVPFAINVVMCIASPFTHWMFNIDENGVYSRGALYGVNMFFTYIYYIISVIVMIRHRTRKERFCSDWEFKYLIIFPIAPLAGSVIQMLIPGISVVYICMVISFLIIFINVQNEQIYTDVGTGLRNKSYLSVYFSEKLMGLKKEQVLGVLLIDLDFFKALNDTFGHTVGDEALRDIAYVLNQTFDANIDCLSRFGGDEFVVIMVREQEEDVKGEIDHFKADLDKFNKVGKRQYQLQCSVGYGVCRVNDAEENLTLDTVLKTADVNMYADKKKNHAAVGRYQSVE